MKKIAAFIFNLSKGGAQGVFVNLVNYLCEKDFDVTVVVQNLADPIYLKELDQKIEVEDLKVNNAKGLLPKLNKYVKKNDFDVAVAFSPEIAVNLCIVRKINNIKFVIIGRCINTLSYEYRHTSSFFRKYITHNLIKIFYHQVDCVIAQSKGMSEDLVKEYGFKESQIYIINNAMGVAFENEVKSSDTLEKQNYILYVGRIEQQKGLHFLLEAFSELDDKEVKLKIIGEGSLKEELMKYAKELDIKNRVEFLPYTRKIVEYYKKAKLTVLSSYFEGFPNVLVESISCGTPIVSFNLPSGPKEIVIEGKNGFLAEYLDVVDLRKMIDKGLKYEWETAEVKESAKRYSRERIMEQYVKVIQKMLSIGELNNDI